MGRPSYAARAAAMSCHNVTSCPLEGSIHPHISGSRPLCPDFAGEKSICVSEGYSPQCLDPQQSHRDGHHRHTVDTSPSQKHIELNQHPKGLCEHLRLWKSVSLFMWFHFWKSVIKSNMPSSHKKLRDDALRWNSCWPGSLIKYKDLVVLIVCQC